MADNPFNTPISGQADWDTGNSQNWGVAERGYHVTERAGQVISSGQIVACTSGGFLLPYNPASSLPPFGYSFTAAGSGDTLSVLGWGIVRSLSINSPGVVGKPVFSNASGFISATTLGPYIGIALMGNGVLFNPDRINPSSLGGAGGGGTLGALSDVNTGGLSDGALLQWSNASSRWVPVVLGNTFVGSAPTVVQFASVQSGNSVTFATTPTSGNLLVAITFSPTNHTAAAGWTQNAETTTGLDFGDIWSKALAAPGTTVQTPVSAVDSSMTVAMWELQGGKGVTPSFFAGSVSVELTVVGCGVGQTPLLSNLQDCIALMAVSMFTSTVNSFTTIYNANSSCFSNSGTVRQLIAGWSNVQRPNAQMFFKQVGSGAAYKGAVGLFTS